MASDERDGGANAAAEEEVQYNAQGKKKQKHDKPKPWDHDGIKHWEVVKIAPEDNPSGLLEESSFATLFPQYRGTFFCVLLRASFVPSSNIGGLVQSHAISRML